MEKVYDFLSRHPSFTSTEWAETFKMDPYDAQASLDWRISFYGGWFGWNYRIHKDGDHYFAHSENIAHNSGKIV